MKISEAFKCPRCGKNMLEEVMTEVTVASKLSSVSDGLCEYELQTNEGGAVDHYQCYECGWIVPGVQTAEELETWLKEHGTNTKNMPLTAELLSFIKTLQDFKQLRISYRAWLSMVNNPMCGSWQDDTEEFFNSIDDNLLAKLHLCKNKIVLNQLLGFTLTDELFMIEDEELPNCYGINVWTPE